MRPPSLLVPLGAVVAAVGITMPIVKVGVHVPDIPVVSSVVSAFKEPELGASADQRVYLYGVVALAIGAWLLPRMVPRLTLVGTGLAIAAAGGATVAAVRGWMVATQGPHALLTGDQPFLERGALNALDELHALGILVVHPGRGLWVLTAGAVLLVGGLLLSLRGGPSSRPRPMSP